MTPDVDDHAMGNSARPTRYWLAPGLPDRQKERGAMQAKRTARKDGGEKRVHAEINREHPESKEKCRAEKTLWASPLPDLLPAPMAEVCPQEQMKRAFVPFLSVNCLCHIPNCMEAMWHPVPPFPPVFPHFPSFWTPQLSLARTLCSPEYCIGHHGLYITSSPPPLHPSGRRAALAPGNAAAHSKGGRSSG